MTLRFWNRALAALVLVVLAARAEAGLLPTAATAIPDNNNFRFTYGADPPASGRPGRQQHYRYADPGRRQPGIAGRPGTGHARPGRHRTALRRPAPLSAPPPLVKSSLVISQ